MLQQAANGLARLRKAGALLLSKLLAERAQTRFDDGCLIEIAVARLGRQFELIDREAQVALPRVELALVLVLFQPLALRRVRARRDLVQQAVVGKAFQLALGKCGSVGGAPPSRSACG